MGGINDEAVHGYYDPLEKKWVTDIQVYVPFLPAMPRILQL